MPEGMESLKWLRDGCNWLVTITAGLIVTSATFYTDILGSNPKLEFLMILGWITLLVSILSGVICYFSAFKKINIKSYKIKAKSWAGLSYSIMLFSFLAGVLSLGVIIIVNKI